MTPKLKSIHSTKKKTDHELNILYQNICGTVFFIQIC